MDPWLLYLSFYTLSKSNNCNLLTRMTLILQLMIHKKNLNARLIFSVIVPISALAFYLGQITLGGEINFAFTVWDGVGLAIVGAGVFLFNYNEEKTQKTSIENF